MHSVCTRADFTGKHIYVGLDIAKKSWKVSIYLDQTYHKRFSQAPDPSALIQYLRRNFPGATYHSVYEAGYFGFWIHRALCERGVDSIVINAADVPTTDKERHVKTDHVDATKLARSLATGALISIYVPQQSVQEDRTLVRMRTSFVRKQTRCKNQIKAFLQYYGYRVPEDITDRYWSRSYIQWLETIRLSQEHGSAAFQALVKELLALRETIAALTHRLRRLAREPRYRRDVESLTSVSGVGVLAALTFLTEVVSVDRFKNLDRLASYVGLVPGEHSSGELERDTGLSRRRNPHLRHILVECAWIAQREDPALLQAFRTYCERMPRNVAIVHLARKLLARMRYVLKHHENYVTGVLSTG